MVSGPGQPSQIFQMSMQPGFPALVGGLIQSTEFPMGAGMGSMGSPMASPMMTSSFGQPRQWSPFGAQQFGMQPGMQQQQPFMGADTMGLFANITSMMMGVMSLIVGVLMGIFSGAISGKAPAGQQPGSSPASMASATNAAATPGNATAKPAGSTVTNGSDIVTVNPASKTSRSGKGNGKPRVIFEGDSLSVHTGQGISYTDQLGARLNGRGIDTKFEATGGDMLTGQIKGDINGIQAQYDPDRKDNVVVLWAGTNDLYSNKSASDVYEQYRKTAQAYKDKGFKVVVLTSPQFGDGGGKNEARQDAERKAFNDMIRKQGGPWDATVDIASMPEFSDTNNAAAASKKYYGGDGVHLSKAGYGLVADQVEIALNQLLGL